MPTGKPVSAEKRSIILKLCEQGLTRKQIAVQVGLSVRAVYDFIKRSKEEVESA